MAEWVEQRKVICITFCIKLGQSSTETIWMIQKAAAMGNWWLPASSRQCNHSRITCPAEFFGETSNQPGDSAPLSPDLVSYDPWFFPKTKITFEREEISDCPWDSGKYDGAADGDMENCIKSVHKISSHVIWKNKDIYWRRYTIQETLYLGQWCLSPLQVGTLGPQLSSPSHHQLPHGIFLNLTDGLKWT